MLFFFLIKFYIHFFNIKDNYYLEAPPTMYGMSGTMTPFSQTSVEDDDDVDEEITGDTHTVTVPLTICVMIMIG